MIGPETKSNFIGNESQQIQKEVCHINNSDNMNGMLISVEMLSANKLSNFINSSKMEGYLQSTKCSSVISSLLDKNNLKGQAFTQDTRSSLMNQGNLDKDTPDYDELDASSKNVSTLDQSKYSSLISPFISERKQPEINTLYSSEISFKETPVTSNKTDHMEGNLFTLSKGDFNKDIDILSDNSVKTIKGSKYFTPKNILNYYFVGGRAENTESYNDLIKEIRPSVLNLLNFEKKRETPFNSSESAFGKKTRKETFSSIVSNDQSFSIIESYSTMDHQKPAPMQNFYFNNKDSPIKNDSFPGNNFNANVFQGNINNIHANTQNYSYFFSNKNLNSNVFVNNFDNNAHPLSGFPAFQDKQESYGFMNKNLQQKTMSYSKVSNDPTKPKTQIKQSKRSKLNKENDYTENFLYKIMSHQYIMNSEFGNTKNNNNNFSNTQTCNKFTTNNNNNNNNRFNCNFSNEYSSKFINNKNVHDIGNFNNNSSINYSINFPNNLSFCNKSNSEEYVEEHQSPMKNIIGDSKLQEIPKCTLSDDYSTADTDNIRERQFDINNYYINAPLEPKCLNNRNNNKNNSKDYICNDSINVNNKESPTGMDQATSKFCEEIYHSKGEKKSFIKQQTNNEKSFLVNLVLMNNSRDSLPGEVRSNNSDSISPNINIVMDKGTFQPRAFRDNSFQNKFGN